MELVNIEKLLDKYFEGKTSLKEEVALRRYFTTHEVPAHLTPYQDLFGYFNLKSNETYKKPLLAKNKTNNTHSWLSVAASVAILLSVFVFNQQNKPSQEELLQNYKNAQEALQLVSENLNKGTFALAQLQEFEKTKDIIFKEK